MRGRSVFTALLSAFGSGLSLWLYEKQVRSDEILPCLSGGCDTLSQSPLAWVGPIHVSLIGVAGYASLVALSLLTWRYGGRLLRRLLFATASAGLLFTFYLQYGALVRLGIACAWCLVSAGCITAIWACSLISLRSAPASNQTGPLA